VGNSNSKTKTKGLRSEVITSDVAVHLTCYYSTIMGSSHKAIGPSKGYRPTPGLIKLFSRTGTSEKTLNSKITVSYR
jgi:hypothetical protein